MYRKCQLDFTCILIWFLEVWRSCVSNTGRNITLIAKSGLIALIHIWPSKATIEYHLWQEVMFLLRLRNIIYIYVHNMSPTLVDILADDRKWFSILAVSCDLYLRDTFFSPFSCHSDKYCHIAVVLTLALLSHKNLCWVCHPWGFQQLMKSIE